jgi:hypothetical protein
MASLRGEPTSHEHVEIRDLEIGHWRDSRATASGGDPRDGAMTRRLVLVVLALGCLACPGVAVGKYRLRVVQAALRTSHLFFTEPNFNVANHWNLTA